MKSSTSLARTRKHKSFSAVHAKPHPAPSMSVIPGFTPRPEDSLALRLRHAAPNQLVLFASICSIVIYALFVVSFPMTKWWQYPHTPNDANAINDMGRITGYSPIAAIAFVFAIIALFGCQFLALLAASRVRQIGPMITNSDKLVRRCILFAPIIFAAIMVWMQPVTTTDLYGYVARGYLFAHLHLNPMIIGATQLPGGAAVDRPAAPYGPLWLLITYLVSRVSGENLFLNMLIFKIIGFASVCVSIWLVDLLARSLFPERRLRIDALFAWSPLLIFEFVGNGHNDIVMVICVLAAFALMLRGWARTAFTLLVLGALIKYFSAVFVALWLIYELRKHVRLPRPAMSTLAPSNATPDITTPVNDHIHPEDRRLSALASRWVREAIYSAREVDHRKALALLSQVTIIGAVLVIACYAPFWSGFNTFNGLGQQLRPLYYSGSLVGFFSAPLRLIVPANETPALDKTIRLLCYTIFGLYAYLQLHRLWFMKERIEMRHIITAAAKITFAALVIITFWFQPWYLGWLLPLAALADEPFVRREGTIFALGALLTYAVSNFLFVGDGGLAQGFFVQLFEILVTFTPLLFLRGEPYNQGWRGVIRRYAALIGQGLTQRPIFWERLMLALIIVVATILRLVRLGNLFTAVSPGASEVDILKEVGGDLKLAVADPQGLSGPFAFLQGALIQVFGPTPLAILLPSAIIGSVTVFVIYLLTSEIIAQGNLPGRRGVALLAALLAATSNWHVSLSRSGMELVILPLLLCLAIYWLLRALRGSVAAHAPTHDQSSAPRDEQTTPRTRPKRSHHHKVASLPSSTLSTHVEAPTSNSSRHQFWLYAGSGACAGLACDVAPGLWLVPLLVLGILAIWQWRRPTGVRVSRRGVLVLAIAAFITGIPVLWLYLSRVIGFPVGGSFLARTSLHIASGPSVISVSFWGQVAHNVGAALSLLLTQDYSAGYPAVGGATIIPATLSPLFYIGVIIIIVRWKNVASLTLLLLVALPLLASISVGAPTGVIEAASVLPAMCIVPALALYQIASWLGHLPIVLDRISGVRIFSNPEQMGRLLLLIFLMFSAIRTFFWYFEVTLPTTPGQQFIPSSLTPRVADARPVHTAPKVTLSAESAIASSIITVVNSPKGGPIS